MSHGLPNVGAVVSHQMCLLGLVLYGFSCGGKDPTPVDTAKADSSDSDSDSGETAVDSETGTETHDSSNAAGEFLPIEVDQEQYADAGYEVVTYALNPDADNQYASLLEGYAPTFYIIRPIERVSDEIPTLFWYHGGAIGDDSNTDDEMPQGCGADKVIYNAEKTLESEFLPVTLSTRFQWAMVVPRNDWCDYWLGQGPDDPIDPERHYGYYHVKRVLDFVMSGDAGYSPSDEVYGWGTSAGGGAAIHIAARMGENTFKGIIVDSAPSSMFVYHDSDPEVLEHLFGGAPYDDAGEPTDAYAGYAEASGETLVQDGGFRTPVYVTWNTKDRLLGAQHPNRLIAALEDVYPDAGVNFGSHDFNHQSPGEYNHTQSKFPHVPWGYTGIAMMRFLQGSEVGWLEAEEGCADDFESACEVGSVVHEDDEDASVTLINHSGGSAIEVLQEDGVGVAYRDAVPSSLSPGTTVDALLIVEGKGLDEEDDDTLILSFAYTEGSRRVERVIHAGDLAPESDGQVEEFLNQYATTLLTFTPEEAGAGVLTVKTYGVGRIYLDGVLFLSDPAPFNEH